MSRATAVYVCMVVALVGGLWAVLRVGSRLQAPPDLSGRWELQPLDPAGPERPAGEERLGRSVRVDQSGRFFRLEFDRGRVMNLRLLRQSSIGSGPARKVRMELGDGTWTLAQPLIQPLFGGLTPQETLSFLLEDEPRDGHGGRPAIAAEQRPSRDGAVRQFRLRRDQ